MKIQNDADYLVAIRRLRLLDELLRDSHWWDGNKSQIESLTTARTTLSSEMLGYDTRRNAGRKGYWFPTASGRRFWPQDVRPEDIDVRDVARALARVCRFGGHLSREVPIYSVAQHSVLVSLHCGEYAREGLLHDAAEAYFGDVTTPVKELLGAAYARLEDVAMEAIAERFGLRTDATARAAVKRADLALLGAEVRDLLPFGVTNYQSPVPASTMRIWPCGAEEAEAIFLERFRQLFPDED